MIQPKFVKKPAKKKPWVKPEIRKISREEYKAMLKTRVPLDMKVLIITLVLLALAIIFRIITNH